MPNPIPKFVQTLHREEPESEDTQKILIERFNTGGVELDPEFKKLCPNAKRTLMFISADMMIMSKTKAKIQSDREATGHWIYSGQGWYVRKLGDEHQFARYMAYDTKSKKNVGVWDQNKYDRENLNAMKAGIKGK